MITCGCFSWQSCFFCLSVVLACSVGCGKEDNQVITPGADYQLTEEEQANKAIEDAMRQEGN